MKTHKHGVVRVRSRTVRDAFRTASHIKSYCVPQMDPTTSGPASTGRQQKLDKQVIKRNYLVQFEKSWCTEYS